ncbi:uncharacterized protein A1O9_03381, partial [Exophiala aquamarina CBS 119918]
MQVAAFLSDLKSLSICSHEAAIALVNPDVRFENKEDLPALSPAQKSEAKAPSQSGSAPQDDDPDLQRAQELVSLHYAVKVNHLRSGLDPELVEARRRVHEIVAAL